MSLRKRKNLVASESSKKDNHAVSMDGENKYASQEYWDERYRNNHYHNWYFTFDEMLPLLTKEWRRLQSYPAVLEIGCGDVPLVTDISRNMNCDTSVGIDFSDTIIDILQSKNCSNLSFSCMDARRMTFQESSFDIVIDKGTLDAMLCSESEGFDNAVRLLFEAVRVLRVGGSIIIISHMEYESDEFQTVLVQCLLPALQSREGVLWSLEVHSTVSVSAAAASSSSSSAMLSPSTTTSSRRKRKAISERVPTNATVYIVRSTQRKMTRSVSAKKSSASASAASQCELSISLKTYEVE